jgi:hypothetical protein
MQGKGVFGCTEYGGVIGCVAVLFMPAITEHYKACEIRIIAKKGKIALYLPQTQLCKKNFPKKICFPL